MVWPAVAAGVSIASSLYSGLSGKKAQKAAAKTARMNAKLIQQETAETIRRTRMQNEQMLGQTKVMQAAAGVANRGTVTEYRDFMEDEQQRQLDWTQRAGDQQAAIVKRGGQLQGNQAMTQGVLGALGTLSSAYQGGAFTPREMQSYNSAPYSMYSTAPSGSGNSFGGGSLSVFDSNYSGGINDWGF